MSRRDGTTAFRFTPHELMERIVAHLGLPSVAPSVRPARPPPQADLPFDVSGFEPDPPAPDDFDT